LLKIPGFKLIGTTVLGLLSVQVLLGITNVLGSLPLPIAVAHNATAALLLITLVTLNFKLTA
jgi:cytochrome c oxidase assembly protein subunit 15